MHSRQAYLVHLEGLCLETYVEYSGAGLGIGASDAGVLIHFKRSLDAVIVRWERTFGRTLRLCVVLHSVANKRTSG